MSRSATEREIDEISDAGRIEGERAATRRGGFGATILFWLMVTTSAAVLAPCLILPAWFEYEAAAERAADAERRERELDKAITAVQKRQEALVSDPAYIERETRREFGEPPAGIEVIPVAPGAHTEGPDLESADSTPEAERRGPLPELSEFVDRSMRKYPLTNLFVRPESRPVLLCLGGGLFAGAILLFGGLFSPRRNLP